MVAELVSDPLEEPRSSVWLFALALLREVKWMLGFSQCLVELSVVIEMSYTVLSS